jgi:DNA-binding GntR family transcriptional regulator
MDVVPTTAAEAAAETTAAGRPNASRVDDPYAWLRGHIVKGELMPKERLVEVDLTASLGVGRATVRTFLSRLKQEGLVVRGPNRGARVRMVSEADALEITQNRGALEALTAREAAVHATYDERGLTHIDAGRARKVCVMVSRHLTAAGDLGARSVGAESGSSLTTYGL